MRNYTPSDLLDKIIITNVWHILVMEQIWRKKGRKGKKQVKLICLFIQLLLYFQEIH